MANHLRTTSPSAHGSSDVQQPNGDPPAPFKEEKKMARMAVFWVSQVLGVIVSVLTLSWILSHRGGFAWRSDPARQFSWHPMFMVLGLVYALGHGIVMFRVFPNLKKWHLKLIHMGINFLAGCCAAFAFFTEIAVKNGKHHPHFQTLHSWIGLIALGLFALQWTAGVLMFLLPCTPNWLRAKTLTWHLRAGKTVYILATFAAVTGIQSCSTKGSSIEEKTLLNVLGIFVVLSMFYHLLICAADSLKYGATTQSRSSTNSYGFS